MTEKYPIKVKKIAGKTPTCSPACNGKEHAYGCLVELSQIKANFNGKEY